MIVFLRFPSSPPPSPLSHHCAISLLRERTTHSNGEHFSVILLEMEFFSAAAAETASFGFFLFSQLTLFVSTGKLEFRPFNPKP